MKSKYDVVVLGAGHNGLVAAAYLARAGLSVLLLEKNDYIGGATTSQKIFPDYDAYLSRYSYLVSLFPEKIIRELDLKLELRRRATRSFTPYVKNGRESGLLLSNTSEETTRQSIFELTGSFAEAERLTKLYDLVRLFADQVWDTMLEPLMGKDDLQRRFETDDAHREAWRSLIEEPLGNVVERYLENDLLRGIVFTDAKTGLLTHPYDETLLQNRCFLYHVIGNQTGEWKVPVGGMGNVVRELEKAARRSGAELLTQVDLLQLEANGERQGIHFKCEGKEHAVEARFLLVNFGRNVLAKYLGKPYQPDPTDEGSVFKINMLLRRLPKLKAKRYPETEAFCGTFRLNEGYEEMKWSHEQASRGHLPVKLPSEIYCHTLTDNSILAPDLRQQGFHTITLFGLDAPWRLFAGNNEAMRQRAEAQFVADLNNCLAEPLEDCLAIARDGSFCLESKSPVDIEEALGLFHGNIFQNALTFPFAESAEQVGTWGVETEFQNVFLCGSSAQRGGAVSGIPGHNAAMKVMALLASHP